MKERHYQSKPDAYVRYKHNPRDTRTEEGELFINEKSYIHGESYCIRPFDKKFRQIMIDHRISTRFDDFEKMISTTDLIECDAIVVPTNYDATIHTSSRYTHKGLDEIKIVKREELETEKSLIDDCRADLLSRQYIIATKMKAPQEVVEELLNEYRKYVTPHHKPLRYTRTKLKKFFMAIFNTIKVIINLTFTFFIIKFIFDAIFK